jgi:hypothetical protein
MKKSKAMSILNYNYIPSFYSKYPLIFAINHGIVQTVLEGTITQHSIYHHSLNQQISSLHCVFPVVKIMQNVTAPGRGRGGDVNIVRDFH